MDQTTPVDFRRLAPGTETGQILVWNGTQWVLALPVQNYSSGIISINDTDQITIAHPTPTRMPHITGGEVVTEWGGAVLVANFSSSANADTGQAATLAGNAGVSGGYLQLDGLGDSLTFPDDPLYDLSNGPFCIEFSFIANSVTGNQHIVNHSADTGPEGPNPYAWAFYLQGDQLKVGVEAWNIVGGNTIGTITPGQEYHVALWRSGSVFRWALQGVVVNSATNSGTITDRAGTVKFGRSQSGIETFNGKIRRFRLTVGESVYGSSSFTPPTADFSAASSRELLAPGTEFAAAVMDNGTSITNISGRNMSAEFVVSF